MKKEKMTTCVSLLIIILFSMSACSNLNTNVKTKDKSQINKFYDIMTLSSEGDGEKLYEVGNSLSNKINVSKIINVDYNLNNNTSVIRNFVSNGSNLTKTNLQIYNGNKEITLNKSFSYSDVILSPKGTKIAFRSFSSDNLSSAEGVSIYSTVNDSKLKFDSDVLISGNLYTFLDDDNILYYGVTNGENDYGKIFDYNFKTNKKTVIYDKFNGYCTFFSALENGNLIFIEQNDSGEVLNYYNKSNNSVSQISSNLSDIYSYVVDEKNNIMYLLGDDSSTGSVQLYSINLTTLKLGRLTYDFPVTADKNGGMAINSLGQVYFCGFMDNSGNNSIFMYDHSTNSTNLITTTPGQYHILTNWQFRSGT